MLDFEFTEDAGHAASTKPQQVRWILEWSLGALALGGASLLIPLYVVELGGSPFLLGILAASAAMVGVPSAFMFGRLADRVPRLVFLVEAVLLTIAAALVLTPLVKNLLIIVLLNAVIWAAFAGIAPVLNLLAVSGAAESQWQDRIARLNAFQGWGWAAGLVLGAVWTFAAEPKLGTLLTYQVFFGACAACVAVAALALALDAPAHTSAMRRLDPRRLRRAVLRAPNLRAATFPFTPGRIYDWALRRPRLNDFVEKFTARLATYYGAALLFFAGFAVFFAPLPLYLDEAGVSGGSIFVLYLISSLGAAAFFKIAGQWASTVNISVLHTVGLMGRALAMPAVVMTGTMLGADTTVGLGAVAALFLVIGGTWALIAVSAATLVVQLAPEGIRGEALGFYAATGSLGGAAGSLLGGWLAMKGYTLAFGVAGGLIVAGAVMVYGLKDIATRAHAAKPQPAS